MREHPVIGDASCVHDPRPRPRGPDRPPRARALGRRRYPDGLSGEEIPIGARVILACDAYHAMISDRPYRRAISHAETIRELGANAGSQFDPQVTEILIGCLYGSRLLQRCARPRRGAGRRGLARVSE